MWTRTPIQTRKNSSSAPHEQKNQPKPITYNKTLFAAWTKTVYSFFCECSGPIGPGVFPSAQLGHNFFYKWPKRASFRAKRNREGQSVCPNGSFFFKFRAQTGPHTQLKESPIILLCPTGHTHTHSCRLPKRTFQIQTETIEPVFEYLFIYFFYFKTRFLTFYFFFDHCPDRGTTSRVYRYRYKYIFRVTKK